MSISRATVEGVLRVLKEEMSKDEAELLFLKLMDIPGNKSFKESIKSLKKIISKEKKWSKTK